MAAYTVKNMAYNKFVSNNNTLTRDSLKALCFSTFKRAQKAAKELNRQQDRRTQYLEGVGSGKGCADFQPVKLYS